MSGSSRAAGFIVCVALVAGALFVRSSGAAAQAPAACSPSTTFVNHVAQPVPADRDIRYGQCLFNSRTDFNQARPDSLFASCSGCHPGNGTDRGTHPVLISGPLGTVVQARQAPNLRNVRFNVPLGWDGRHGGRLGDDASIAEAIKSASMGAINSPVEMAGRVDPANPLDQAKLASLAAFIMSRSRTSADPNAASTASNPLDPETLARIRTGAEVFFGRSNSTRGLVEAGKACVSCHVPPFFTDNKLRTNILHPSAAYDFGFPQADGSTGPVDPGAGLVTVTEAATEVSVQVGTFKTPSLHRFYPDGEPSLHGGIFGDDGRLFRFYERSLGFTLAPGESTGLHYWLVHCPRGPEQAGGVPAECGVNAPDPLMALDTPTANATARQPFTAAGWAVDRGALTGTGVDAVHVWAFRGSDGQATFVGFASLGGSRPDVGAALGNSQFNLSGFSAVVQGLAPGTYDLAVFVHSTVSASFSQARVVRVIVQ